MTYQEYVKILMDELENECSNNTSKPVAPSKRRNTKETNDLIDKLTDVMRLINKAKVDVEDDIDQTKLKFEITHQLNEVSIISVTNKVVPISRTRKSPSLSPRTILKQKVG